MESFKTFSETVLNSKKQAFISYLHRIMWVGIQITRLEGPEDYTLFKNELNYFGKIFPLFFTFPKHCHGVTSWSLGTWLRVAVRQFWRSGPGGQRPPRCRARRPGVEVLFFALLKIDVL